MISVLSKCDFVSEDKINRVVGVLDDISLMVTVGKDENLIEQMNISRVIFLQLLYLEKLYAHETKN